jgi:anaerobic selenocysteine-containing dehydrogenase
MQFDASTIDKPGKPIAKALHGTWMAPAQGFDRPDVALLIGMNPVVSYQGAPFGNPGKWLTDRIKSGMQLIVVDPRGSDVARRAAIHLQPRPGTDAAILAAMINVILEEGLIDHDFVALETTGLEELERSVARFDPSTVADYAGVPVSDLVTAARLFAQASRGYAVAGTGANMSGAGTLMEYLVLDLMTLCGRWLREGEVVRNPGTLSKSRQFVAQARPPMPAFGLGEQLRVRGLTASVAGLPTAALAEEMLLEGDGQVRCLLSCGGNPASAWPDSAQTVNALAGLDLLVQIDPWMSATARLADYVIAPTMPLETADITLYPEISTFPPHLGTTDAWAQYSPAVVDRPVGSDLIEEWEFFYGLAKRLNVPLRINELIHQPITEFELDLQQQPTSDEVLERLVADGRVSLDEVKSHPGGVSLPDPDARVLPRERGWTGRLELADRTMMEDLGALELQAPFGEGGPTHFRLICRRTPQAYNSSCIDASTHRGRLYNPAFLHPLDMAELGLSAGQPVEIIGEDAVSQAIVEPDDHLRRGVLSMSHGYGTSEEQEVEQRGTNVNELTAVDAVYDPYSGQPQMSNVPVQVVALSRSGRL